MLYSHTAVCGSTLAMWFCEARASTTVEVAHQRKDPQETFSENPMRKRVP